MKCLLAVLLGICSQVITTADVSAKEPLPARYEEALDLIHAFSGAGDELRRAMQLADELLKSHPKSGYSQTLRAEALSTWRLDDSGRPVEILAQVLRLSDEAVSLNPGMAQPHVAKGRALARVSAYPQAEGEINTALALDPTLDTAIFMRADLFRRTNKFAESEIWYKKFIAATPSQYRQSNGYYWLGRSYSDAARQDAPQQKVLIAKARASYQRMVDLDPNGAWKNVNFAIFLNDQGADFVGAAQYASRALNIMEFPMARYHLAAARYQQLWAALPSTDRQSLTRSVMQVHSETRVSLQDAVQFSSFSTGMRARLAEVQARLADYPVGKPNL